MEPYGDDESTLKKQEIEEDYGNWVSKSLDIGIRARVNLLGYTSQARLFANASLSSLTEVGFDKQEFSAGKPIFDIKYCLFSS